MSSACTIVSPSHVSAGPGGCLTEVSTASNRVMVSAGEEPRFAATPLAWTLSKLNPEPIILAKKAGGVRLAADVMCASTSRTDHWPHIEGVAHSSPVRPFRSAASALRSSWIAGQISMSPPLRRREPPPLPRPFYSVRAKLANCRISGNRIVVGDGRQGARHPEGAGGARLTGPARDPQPDLGPRAVRGGDRRCLPGDQTDDLPAPGRAA